MKPTEVFHRIVPCVAHLYCWKAMSHELRGDLLAAEKCSKRTSEWHNKS